MIQEFLSDGNLGVFERKYLGVLYHFTMWENALNILKDDLIKCSPSEFSYELNNDRTRYYISLTRDKNFWRNTSYGLGFDTKFILDGDRISDNNMVRSVEYSMLLYADYLKHSGEKDTEDLRKNFFLKRGMSGQRLPRQEMPESEERVYFSKANEGLNIIKNRYLYAVELRKDFVNTLIRGLFTTDKYSYEKEVFNNFVDKLKESYKHIDFDKFNGMVKNFDVKDRFGPLKFLMSELSKIYGVEFRLEGANLYVCRGS